MPSSIGRALVVYIATPMIRLSWFAAISIPLAAAAAPAADEPAAAAPAASAAASMPTVTAPARNWQGLRAADGRDHRLRHPRQPLEPRLRQRPRGLCGHDGVDPPQPAQQLGHRQRPVRQSTSSATRTRARCTTASRARPGFNFWESAGYTFAGSAFWEIFGETTPPSRNDQVASGIGGTFLGEALFRMSNLLLEQGGGMSRPGARSAAALISPVDRLQPARLRRPLRRHLLEPRRRRTTAGCARLRAQPARGQSASRRPQFEPQRGAGRLLARLRPAGQERLRVHAAVRLLQLPGDGVERERLRERADARPAGRQAYEAGPDYRGVWGIYGSYDYISPQTFRISTTGALARHDRPLVADARPRARRHRRCSASATAAVGTAHSASSDRDYNYGVDAAGAAGAAPDVQRPGVARRDRARVLRQQGRRREPRAATTTSSASTPR